MFTKQTSSLQPPPLTTRGFKQFNSREGNFLAQYRTSHMTLTQIANKYGRSAQKMLAMLPPPDVICPFGNKTKLWRRESVLAKMGEPKP